MPDPFSVSTTLAVPVWAVIALALALFVLLIWAALPLLSKPVASRWPFANPDANALLAAMVILGTLLFLGAVGAAFTVLLHTFRVTETGGAGPNLGAGALIAALLGAPFLIWGTVLKHQTVRYQKEGHMTDRIAKAVEMLGAEKTVKEYHIADDGTPVAVERTTPNLEVRIGAILSLERIAQDSTTHDKGRDHVRVMEVLCAYVRENSPANTAQDHPFGAWKPLNRHSTTIEQLMHSDRCRERFGGDEQMGKIEKWVTETLREPREDIQKAMRVLGRRTAEQRLVEASWPKPPNHDTIWPFDIPCPRLNDHPREAALSIDNLRDFEERLDAWRANIEAYSGYRIDLRETNLQCADFSAMRSDRSDSMFSGALFEGARLEGADFWRSLLHGANLSHARLECANFLEAKLNGASLQQATMEGATLDHAEIIGALLHKAHLNGSSISQARLESAIFSSANMECAFLNWSRLEGSDLGDSKGYSSSFEAVRMEFANLSTAILVGADFLSARLEGLTANMTDLRDADLSFVQVNQNTDLHGALLGNTILRSGDFSLSEIPVESLEHCFGDSSVTLPYGVVTPEHWPSYRLDDDSFESEIFRWRSNPADYTPPPDPAQTRGHPLPKP
ncbi:pentapeptide repeat-containing protein [Pararhodobacter zhoushanensis]|uniref:pentapeptide repeat-containing protein n=1 Tax=Pararhodobacter zhoushanensis TaxID=2479545 RepID=UPI000F8CD108|nr:pentapeptide repeat-containing protein [Pararhodobacter zhoushanensis]